MYDTLIDTDGDGNTVELQVKVFDRILAEYRPGDKVPERCPLTPSYSIVHPDGDFYANVTDNTFVGFSQAAEHPAVISKWGGPADQENPIVSVLRELNLRETGRDSDGGDS